MRFPDLLVEVKRLEARLRAVEFDLRDIRRRLTTVAPGFAAEYLGPELPGQQSLVDDVSRETDAQQAAVEKEV